MTISNSHSSLSVLRIRFMLMSRVMLQTTAYGLKIATTAGEKNLKHDPYCVTTVTLFFSFLLKTICCLRPTFICLQFFLCCVSYRKAVQGKADGTQWWSEESFQAELLDSLYKTHMIFPPLTIGVTKSPRIKILRLVILCTPFFSGAVWRIADCNQINTLCLTLPLRWQQ